MDLQEALRLLGPAVPRSRARWADLGAGRGLFTRALVELLEPGSTVVAVDHDRAAVSSLRRLAGADRKHAGTVITPARGDFRRLSAIPELAGMALDGVLFANALHFVADPASVLRQAASFLAPAGRVVVIEYDGRPASRWVPHPVSRRDLIDIGGDAGLRSPAWAAQRPSAFGGTLYCAVLERRDPDPEPAG